MFDITKRTTITTDWAQLKTVQEQMNLAEIMLEVGSEFPICLEADADNENDVFEQLTAQVVHVTKEGRVMVVLKDCMEKMRAMNDHATNKGGWKDSAMRKWLNEDVLPRLPKELQAMIVPRTIRQKINGEEVQTQDKLWLPSFTEMFGAKAAAEWAPGDLGDEQFELFDSERSRVKEVTGRGTWWYWLRSPIASNSTFSAWSAATAARTLPAPAMPMAWPSASAFNPESTYDLHACARADRRRKERTMQKQTQNFRWRVTHKAYGTVEVEGADRLRAIIAAAMTWKQRWTLIARACETEKLGPA